LLNDDAHFLEYFHRYLEIEGSIGSRLPKVTDPKLCYETPHGYCEQRTAWISQLIANYYYNEGIKAPDGRMKIKYFKLPAGRQACTGSISRLKYQDTAESRISSFRSDIFLNFVYA
jgi:hypothetical protein